MSSGPNPRDWRHVEHCRLLLQRVLLPPLMMVYSLEMSSRERAALRQG